MVSYLAACRMFFSWRWIRQQRYLNVTARPCHFFRPNTSYSGKIVSYNRTGIRIIDRRCRTAQGNIMHAFATAHCLSSK